MNQKKLILIAIFILLVLLGIGTYLFFHGKDVQAPSNQVTKPPVAMTPKDATYTIDGQAVTLVNGISKTTTTSSSASKTTTQYFGNEATGDLNGDGVPDTGFILTQNSGGSGVFYYAVAAIKSGEEYLGTNAILLGDRIAPQTTEIKDGVLVVNYADRNPNEPMTAQPSVGVSKYLLVENNTLIETSKTSPK